ncbi:MAG: hypothetical protein AVDCRST_MAG23-1716, partial [uncultured Sphingosinicella sp.]
DTGARAKVASGECRSGLDCFAHDGRPQHPAQRRHPAGHEPTLPRRPRQPLSLPLGPAARHRARLPFDPSADRDQADCVQDPGRDHRRRWSGAPLVAHRCRSAERRTPVRTGHGADRDTADRHVAEPRREALRGPI